jgi:hypothetical protein
MSISRPDGALTVESSSELLNLTNLQKEYEHNLVEITKQIKNIKNNLLTEKVIAKKIADKNLSWERFRYARIRVDNESDMHINLNDVWRAYRLWYEAVGVDTTPRLTQIEVLSYFQKEFGINTPYQRYRGISVFWTEEDLEEYDKTHKLEAEEATCTVCYETKTECWAWNTTPVKNAPVCDDCLSKR